MADFYIQFVCNDDRPLIDHFGELFIYFSLIKISI